MVFFIKTINEIYYDGILTETSTNYRSYVIVFDITNSTNLVANIDRAMFSVTNLFGLEFITVNSDESCFWRKSDATDTEYLNDNYDYYTHATFSYAGTNDYCVVPLFDLNNNAQTNRYYLNDICFAGNLQNEQAYNEIDTAYSENNDIGSFFTRLDYIYDGKFIQEGSFADIDYASISEIIVNNMIALSLTQIPHIGGVLSTVFGIFTDVIEVSDIVMEGLSDKEHDITNNTYSTQAYYVNRDDQIEYYGYLTKCAYFALNTDPDLTILYEKNDYAKVEYTIGHSALNGQQANYTRMYNEIALKIVDRDGDIEDVAVSREKFNLREPAFQQLSISNNNKLLLLDGGTNYYSFTPTYTGKYKLNINLESQLKVTFSNLTNQGTIINLEKVLNKETTYYLIIENKSNDRINQNFNFDVASDLNNIPITGNNNYLVKISNTSGFKKILYTNTNGEVKLLNSNFSLLKENDTNQIYYTFANTGIYYVLIENSLPSSISGNLQEFKAGGFLGIGATTYNQYQYVATGTNAYGRKG